MAEPATVSVAGNGLFPATSSAPDGPKRRCVLTERAGCGRCRRRMPCESALRPAARRRTDAARRAWDPDRCSMNAGRTGLIVRFGSVTTARPSRRAFVHTARSVIDSGGQRGDATDKALSRTRRPDAARVGRQGPGHPGPPRDPRARQLAGQPAAGLRGRGPLPPPRRPSPSPS